MGVISLKESSKAQGSREIIHGNAKNESGTEPSTANLNCTQRMEPEGPRKDPAKPHGCTVWKSAHMFQAPPHMECTEPGESFAPIRIRVRRDLVRCQQSCLRLAPVLPECIPLDCSLILTQAARSKSHKGWE